MLTAVAVASDSRGGGLIGHLKRNLPANFVIAGESKTGANFATLFKIIRHTTRQFNEQLRNHRTVVLICGGICDFTSRTQGDTGLQVHYDHKDNRLNQVKGDITDIITYCRLRGYTPIFTTIVGVDLAKSRDHHLSKNWLRASRFSPEELAEQQKRLDADLNLINESILEGRRNNIHGACNINRDSELRAFSTRGRNTKKVKSQTLDSALVYDGVHSCYRLSDKTFRKITDAITGYLAHCETQKQPEKKLQETTGKIPSLQSEDKSKRQDKKRKKTRSRKKGKEKAKTGPNTSGPKNALPATQTRPEEGDSQSSQAEDESWQFKRQRKI
jgi:hypothetical protein